MLDTLITCAIPPAYILARINTYSSFIPYFFHTKKAPCKDASQQIIFGCPRNKLVFEVRLLSPRFELERFLVRLSGLA